MRSPDAPETVSSAEVADFVACHHKVALNRGTAAGPATVTGDPTRDLVRRVDATMRSAEWEGDRSVTVPVPTPTRGVRSVRVGDVEAFVRRARARAEAFGVRPGPTIARPCDHCAHCPWADRCRQEWIERDDLTLVAGAFGAVVDRLADHGIDSVARLAAAPLDPPAEIDDRRYRTLRRQARLQVAARSGADRPQLLAPDEHPGGGFLLLPPPDPGDLFLDLEGDPHRGNGGLEYLWGLSDVDDAYRCWWGHTPTAERAAFETVVDSLTDHLAAHPRAHVYHYASYEIDVLRRLALRYASREDRIERIIQQRRLVDLYRVVRQTIATSRPGYGMKQLEHFYRRDRDTDVQDGLASVAAYEAWLSDRDPRILDDIQAYNRDDCISTRQLRDWLEERRAESIERFGPVSASAPSRPEPLPPTLPRSDAEARSARRLRAALPDALERRDHADRRDDLLLQLLEWHRREARRPSRPPSPVDDGSPPASPTAEHAALVATVEAVANGGPEGRAFDRLLRREPPDAPGGLRPRDGETSADVVVRVGRSLRDDYLAVQAPPGTRPADALARLVDGLLADGRRVGICGPTTHTDPVLRALAADDRSVVAGPIEAFAAPARRGDLDVLVVTRAGTVSLAGLAAAALSASTLVLCGDPAGVDRPTTRGRHPSALRRSVLSHLLDGDGAMPADRGVLLDRPVGIHPEIVSFVSDLAYDGRLHPVSVGPDQGPPADRPAGLGWVPVRHHDRTTASPEEAAAVTALIETLEPDATDDVLIVAPFAEQVRLLSETVSDGYRVATVEQIGEHGAPVVILSLTASAAEGIPGGRNRVFSRHRLTAALSAASDLAVVVASPQLLEARCRSPRQMAQLSALIRYAELATPMTVARSAASATAR